MQFEKDYGIERLGCVAERLIWEILFYIWLFIGLYQGWKEIGMVSPDLPRIKFLVQK
jgi:hypothetical protein